jgi:5-methylcytosine-specific restriction endonuclease McrA
MPAFSTYFFTLGRGEEDHNLIAACHSCNSIKHCRTPEDAGMVIKFREGKEVELYVLA